jgi:hypothetical protein
LYDVFDRAYYSVTKRVEGFETAAQARSNANEVAVIVFPFGFYSLDGRTPVYVGNDLDAQNTVRAWMEAYAA